ncbi:MAG TPA: acyl-CoA desaturase [Kofleriaceae bacterium]
MSAQLRSLRAELTAAGVFESRELRGWIELFAMLAALAGCLVGIALTGWIGALALVPIAAVLCTSISMLGHEGSHRSFSASPTRNAILCYLTFPLFGGLGALYWRNKHDRLHHGHPNVEGVDPDIRPFPFSSSRGDHQRAGIKTRWFQRNFQRHLFWPMSTLMALGMRRSSILYLLSYPNKREGAWWAEVACMTVHYTSWLVIPSIVWGPLVGFAVYAAIWGLVGVFLALVFAPAHMGLPIVEDQNHDWLHQLETTRNLELPRVVSFFFIGLDYQVEHHLFPKIPHANLPRAAAITAAWCKRHNVTYQTMPYLDALADAVSFMKHAWDRDASTANAIRLAS